MHLLLLPPRPAWRALEDLHALALAATALGGRLGAPERGAEIVEAGRLLRASADDLAARGAQVAEALPVLERAATMVEPLEGAVERFVDRLPGAARSRPSG